MVTRSIVSMPLTWPPVESVSLLAAGFVSKESYTDVDVHNLLELSNLLQAALHAFGDVAGHAYFAQMHSRFAAYKAARIDDKSWRLKDQVASRIYPFSVTTASLTALQTERVVQALVHDSQWFEVTPLPDGVYRVTVKDENKRYLTAEGEL